VLSHLLQPLSRDVAATGDVLQERDHVIGSLRAAKGQQQQRVVRRHVPIQSALPRWPVRAVPVAREPVRRGGPAVRPWDGQSWRAAYALASARTFCTYQWAWL